MSNDTLDTFVIYFYQLINWSLTFTLVLRQHKFFNIYAMILSICDLSSYRIELVHINDKWYMQIYVLRQGSHTEGAPTVIDFLEMTKFNVNCTSFVLGQSV